MTNQRRDGQLLQELDCDLIEWMGTHQIGYGKHYEKGRILHWQGDPIEVIFIIVTGAVKVSSVSEDGRNYIYNVVGPGALLGVQQFILGQNYDTLAEAVEDTEVYCLLPDEFERLLKTEPGFSLAVMKRQAQDIHLLGGKMRDFSLLDVQQRLKSNLIELAQEHGIVTKHGIRINLNITHQEIGEMVAANRATITTYLNELKQQGYVWNEGRRLYILPPEQIEILDHLDQAIVDGNKDDAQQWALEAVSKDIDMLKALEALNSGMRRVDRMFAREENDIGDIILSAYAMKSAISIIEERIARSGTRVEYPATIVIGTVYGDIHDIGRTIVSMLLKARGFNVIDLGINVPVEEFVNAVRDYKPQILAMSTLMTTTAQELFKVIHALVEEGLRDRVKIIVGGSAITPRLVEQMGADGYEASAHQAAELSWRLTRQSLQEQAKHAH